MATTVSKDGSGPVSAQEPIKSKPIAQRASAERSCWGHTVNHLEKSEGQHQGWKVVEGIASLVAQLSFAGGQTGLGGPLAALATAINNGRRLFHVRETAGSVHAIVSLDERRKTADAYRADEEEGNGNDPAGFDRTDNGLAMAETVAFLAFNVADTVMWVEEIGAASLGTASSTIGAFSGGVFCAALAIDSIRSGIQIRTQTTLETALIAKRKEVETAGNQPADGEIHASKLAAIDEDLTQVRKDRIALVFNIIKNTALIAAVIAGLVKFRSVAYFASLCLVSGACGSYQIWTSRCLGDVKQRQQQIQERVDNDYAPPTEEVVDEDEEVVDEGPASGSSAREGGYVPSTIEEEDTASPVVAHSSTASGSASSVSIATTSERESAPWQSVASATVSSVVSQSAASTTTSSSEART